MAGDWIKIEHATPDKPEVFAMAGELGIDPDAVVGKLIRLWVWADQQSIDGNAIPVTPAIIDRITHQPGFSDALRMVRWLEVRSGSLQVPRFARHNGQTAKARADSNRRVARHRKRRCNGKDVTDVTEKPLLKPLPEKRREEEEERVCASARDAHRVVELYPRREKLTEALAIVQRDLAEGQDLEAMIAGTQACAAVIRTLPSGHLNRYVPSAETFFRTRRWADDPETLKRQGNSATGQGALDLEEAKRQLGGRAAYLEDDA